MKAPTWIGVGRFILVFALYTVAFSFVMTLLSYLPVSPVAFSVVAICTSAALAALFLFLWDARDRESNLPSNIWWALALYGLVAFSIVESMVTTQDLVKTTVQNIGIVALIVALRIGRRR